MKILIVTPIYLPEQSPISHLLADIVECLTRKDHSVEIVTGIASWLLEEKPKLESNKFFIEKSDNVKIYRLPFIKRESKSLIDKFLDYYWFRILVNRYKNRYKKPDVIYVPVPSNETGMAAKALAKHFNCRYVINVQDIHPDAIFGLGLIRIKLLKALLKNQEMRMYKSASHIIAIGDSFKKNLIDKGVLVPIKVIPNWVRLSDYSVSGNGSLHKKWGINKDKFVVLYSGTLGRIHGTSVILDAAEKLLNESNILFLLVGHGFNFDLIKKETNKRNLYNVLIKDYVPRANLAEMQALSNISLVTLRAQLGYSSIPSKVLGYMASSRPIIAMTEVDTDTGNLVRRAKCGLVIPPGDSSSLAKNIKELKGKTNLLEEWGTNGFKYLQENFDRESLIDQINDVLTEIK
ncbi:glycosyltransferase family 4 protein [Alphaproteobacteria bacterium]|nr:glycosyltransferase family 4 protein [Alphaproteobacteria bacterium]